MSRRWLLAVSILAALALAAPAVAASNMTIAATGTGNVRVIPHNRKSNASIAAAYAASVPAAITQAHVLALRYAHAAGLTLGSIVAISDAQNQNGPYFSYAPGRSSVLSVPSSSVTCSPRTSRPASDRATPKRS